MEEYLKTLLDQIRCKKAHSYIEEEIRGHIEEQIKTNLSMGMTYEEAVEEAITDMGSPVETGIALDQIHRPKMAWDMVILMGIISVLGTFVHTIIGNSENGSSSFAIHTILGFVVMLVVYRMDYSFIAKYAKKIAVAFLAILFLTSYTAFGVMVNGQNYWFSLGGIRFSIFAFMMLYVPVFGAVLYQYYGTGYDGIVKTLVWMMMPVFMAARLPSLSLAVILYVSMGIILSLSVYKGWFKVSRKKVIGLFWGVLILAPVFALITGIGFRLFKAYQIVRLRAFFTNSGDANYITEILRNCLMESSLIGGNGIDMAETLPEFNTNYIFNYIVSSYGILAGVVLCGILTFLIIKIFMISLKQRNQLGMIMGCGCGTVILINAGLNVFQSLGLLPPTQSFLPFFSYGGSFIIISYAMMGLILSIYRYKNIFPIRFRNKKEVVR